MRRSVCVGKTVVLCVLTLASVVGVMGTDDLEAQAVRATIQGTVRDSSGAALPGATVDVKNVATGVVQSVTSDNEGRFTVPDLIVGDYEVQATLSGFRTVVQQGIRLSVGMQRVVDFELPLGQLEESITVEAAAAQVDLVSSAVATTIEQKQIAELPLNGRNYSQLIALAPGVQSMPQGGSLFGRQSFFSVSGGRPEGQAYLLDNTNIGNFWNRAGGSGVLGTTLGVEAIAEFQTLTNTYSAQFGGGGAVINAVTRSGSNAFHGSVFEFVRNSRFDARNFFDTVKPPFEKNQFGGSFHGPIKRDRAFFFVTYEGIRQSLGETRVATVPDANAHNGLIPIGGVLTNVGVHPSIKPILDLYALPTRNTGPGVGQVDFVDTSEGDEDYVLGRMDFTLSEKDSIFGRFVSDTAFLLEPFSGAAAAIPLWPAENRTRNHYFTTEHRRIFSSAFLNQVRFGFVRTREIADNVGGVPALDFFPNRMNGTVNPGSGITTIGSNQLNPFDLVQRKYAVANDVYWTRGNHSFRVGGSIERIESDTLAPFQWGGAWTFNGLQAFLQNQPTTLNAALPGQEDAFREFREWDFVAYIHDEWRVANRLTLNLGLRYAPTTNATVDPGFQLLDPPFSPAFEPVESVFASNASFKNIDPRIGFAWDLFEDHKTSIRGGFGVFHNVIAPRVYASAYYINPPYQIAIENQPVFPTPFVTPRTAASVSQGIDYDTTETPYQMQWNINVQREIMEATVVTVGYVGARGDNLFKQRDVNPVTPTTLADGTVVYGTPSPTSSVIVRNPRVNPAFQSLNFGGAFADSSYHSLQVSMSRRLYRNLSANLAYTLSKCEDVSSGNFGGEGGTSSTNPYDPEYDRGPCGFDRTHTLRGGVVYTLPFAGNQWVEGWQVSGILNLNSGPPFTPTVFDQSGLGTGSQRPSLAPGASLDDAIGGEVAQWFDPTVFVLPRPGTLGDVGRNSLRGPAFITVDASVSKNIDFPNVSEAFGIQLRAEVFNLLNRANFAVPTAAAATVFSAAPNGGGTLSPSAGRITTLLGDARRIQFAVKMLF